MTGVSVYPLLTQAEWDNAIYTLRLVLQNYSANLQKEVTSHLSECRISNFAHMLISHTTAVQPPNFPDQIGLPAQ